MNKPKAINRDLIKSQLEGRLKNGGDVNTAVAEPPVENKPAEQPTETPKVESGTPQETPKETPQAQPTEQKVETPEVKSEEVPKAPLPKSSLTSTPSEEQKPQEFSKEDLIKFAEENGYIKKDEFKTGHEVVDSILEKWKEGVDWDKQKLHTWTDNIESYNVDNQTEALELVKRQLKSEGFTAKQIDYKLKKDYPALYDRDADEEEAESSLIQLSIDAQKAKQNILREREKYFIPEKNTAQTGETIDKAKLVQDSLNSMYEDTRNTMGQFYDQNLKGYEKEVFSIGDKSIEFKVTPEMEQSIRNDFANYFDLLDRKSQAAGENAAQELRKTILVANYFDDILKTVADQFEANGKEDLIKEDIKNVPKETTGGQKTTKAVNPQSFSHRNDFLKAQIEQQLKEGRLHKTKR